ncbi:hypothetical protein ABZ611_27560 [Streptomyces sp. NPDC007861]|uniref:hypothetical protein n=1 Tax=Streptomyces sp. NPDC007861 TaxID=3154893 RepID=UPI0033E7DFE2
MPECTYLEFSIRTDATMTTEEMARRAARALDCVFEKGYHLETPAWTTKFLGMEVHLYEWRGVGNTRIFRLHGRINRRKYSGTREGEEVTFLKTNIDRQVIDLLGMQGAGQWRTPSKADIAAEIDFGSAGD